jgi:hypothetical protein
MVREHEHPGKRVILSFGVPPVRLKLGFPSRQLALALVQNALALVQLADANGRLAAGAGYREGLFFRRESGKEKSQSAAAAGAAKKRHSSREAVAVAVSSGSQKTFEAFELRDLVREDASRDAR